MAAPSPDPKNSGASNVLPKPLHIDVQALRDKVATLQKLAEQKPNTPEARAALVEEVYTLTKLAHLQDASLDQQRHGLVERLKKDETLPRSERAKLSSLSDNVDVGANRSLDPDQRMSAFANVAWKQLQEFPDNTENYAALLRIARDSNDSQAKKIAEDLLVSPAPEEIKQGARAIRARTSLVGKSLKDLLGDDQQQLGATGPSTLFTWTSNQSTALNLVKALKQAFPNDTAILAVCLDKDPAAARAIAAQQKLEAQFVFPEGGNDAALCKKLLLDGPLVYRIDPQGVITTVSGLNQLAVEHWKKAKEAKK